MRTLAFAAAALAVHSAFAFSTRAMKTTFGRDMDGRWTAHFAFAPDNSGFVAKYGLYVAWADSNMGLRLSGWANRAKLADVTPETASFAYVLSGDAASARCVRFFLAEPTLSSAAREDGVELVESVSTALSGKTGCLVSTGYKPTGTSALETMCFLAGPGDSKFAALFCARDTSSAANAKTYTSFLHQKDGAYFWRVDYGSSASTELNLGFSGGETNRIVVTADGSLANMAIETGTGKTGLCVSTALGGLEEAGNELALFGSYGKDHSDNLGNYATSTLWGFVARDGDEVKVNLLPATKTEGEVKTAGLYDVVSGEFRESLTSTPLSASESAPLLEDCSDLLDLEVVNVGLERTMRAVPTVLSNGTVAKVDFYFPPAEMDVPYELSAVYSDATNKIADVGAETAHVRYIVPPHRGVEARKKVSFMLQPAYPDGYTPLLYVTKPGDGGGNKANGAYIVTTNKVNGTTEFRGKVTLKKVSGESSAWAVFCARSASALSATDPGLALFALNSNKWRYDYNAAGGPDEGLAATNTPSTLHARVPGGLSVTTDSSSITYGATRTAAEFESKGPLVLLASYTGVSGTSISGIGNNRTLDVHWMAFKDSGGDVFALAPVTCTAEGENNGKVGFYDFAGGKFMPSSSSTAFVAGGEGCAFVVTTDEFSAPERQSFVVIVR